MKKFGIFFVSAFALLAFAACSDDEDEGTITPGGVEEEYDDAYYASQATVTSSDANFTATDEGGEIFFKTEGGTVTLSVSCGCDWTADNDATDLFATSVTSSTLTITAEPNTVEEELTGTVTVKTANEGIVFATIEITQAAYGAPEISVETNEWNFPATGDLTAEIKVVASADWTAEAADTWVTVTKTDTGISLTAEENTVTEERTTKVTLTCTDGISSAYDYVTVNQEAATAPAYINLSAESVNFDGDGGSAEVTVESNYDWEFSYDEEENAWFTVTANGNTLTVTASANLSTEGREGTVTITAGDGEENVAEAELTVTQEKTNGMILTYDITSNIVAILPLYESEDGDVAVNCTVDWGDGTVETITKNHPQHEYTERGDIDIVISGTVPHLYSSDISVENLIAVKQWGEVGLTSMRRAFFESGLQSLPEETGNALVNVTDFMYCFYNCSALTKIPNGLFSNCPSAKKFYGCFYNCSALTEIPAGLFDGCSSVTDFEYCFYNCTTLTSIPEDIFKGCVAVDTFAECFYCCTSLTSIPSGLFNDCTEVTTFYRAFRQCTQCVTIPENLFKSCRKVTAFNECFCAQRTGKGYLTGESAYDLVEIDGNETKIHLYERDLYPEIYTAPTASSSCYGYQTSLTDYNTIPSGWGGGGN